MNLRWLLTCIPIGIALHYFEASPTLVFIVSALSVVPLAGLMGNATEALSRFLGPTPGALLNATMGNAPEIIIGFFALKHGLVEMVKASITGTILGNLLFGLGVSIVAGGLKRPAEKIVFEIDTARIYAGLMMLATIALIIPAVFNFSTNSDREISLHIAAILFVGYLISVGLVLTQGNAGNLNVASEDSEATGADWSRNLALAVLGGATLGLAAMSEIMTDAIAPAARSMGFTPLFAGIFLLALVGNTAELINSVHFARSNQISLSLGITVGSSAQTALMVVPLLVFFGAAIGQNMNLLFSRFELVAIVLTVYAVINILQAGSVRIGAGLFLILVYVMFGIGFYYASAGLGS
ncbi:calcium/proton exchanger [Methylococcus sp. ANG]|uniref:calcium/proton exchanger n=1 Tax=Methylococcus sp. ANG TaxID=3231903 RepID=UPI0034594FAA